VSHDADVDALIVGAGPVGLYAWKVWLIAVGFGEAATASTAPSRPSIWPCRCSGYSSDLAA
jgi:threonine dehydrogenase-like Zn-dependent dehydrogenase